MVITGNNEYNNNNNNNNGSREANWTGNPNAHIMCIKRQYGTD